MENRRNRTSEELAETKKELFGFRSSSRTNQTAFGENKDALAPSIPAPIVTIEFNNDVNQFFPADFLICEYEVDLLPQHDVHAIETSVIWLTEGKGDTDIGVHFFERRQRHAITNETFSLKQRLSTVLPASPLSYEGEVLSIHWCVRVRVFLVDGLQSTTDEYFRLGTVRPFKELAQELSESADDTETDIAETGAA